MSDRNLKFLAYYLPQYHPIPENDKWWGAGFTEWTNVVKAKPLFKGHRQPLLPSHLGFYDLRLSETRRAQAQLANNYGIDGFIYYQYWFGNGKMLLEEPAEKMLDEGKPDFPFCFCWANETWKGIWHGVDNPEILIEQKYYGRDDYIRYFNYLLPFFQDSRYIKVKNEPMFHIYRIEDIPDLKTFIDTFSELAVENGFDGIYFVATLVSNYDLVLGNKEIKAQVGLNNFAKMRFEQSFIFPENTVFRRIELKVKKIIGHNNIVGERKKPKIVDYEKGVSKLHVVFPHNKYITCVFPNWDNSARSGKKSLIFKNSNPVSWKIHLQKAVNEFLLNPGNPPFIVIKSWNEWAEGNYLEPDVKYELQWLEAVRSVKNSLKIKTPGSSDEI